MLRFGDENRTFGLPCESSGFTAQDERDALAARLGAGVASLDASGVTLSNGEHIETETVIWAAGIRAAPLTQQIPAERDNFGRLLVDRDLRVPGPLVKNSSPSCSAICAPCPTQ